MERRGPRQVSRALSLRNEPRTALTGRRRVFPRRAIRQFRLAHLDSRGEEASPPRALTTRDEQEKSELKSPRCETGTRGTRLREVPVGIVKVVGHGANNASCRGKLFLLPRLGEGWMETFAGNYGRE